MFELTAGAAGWACGLLFIAAFVLLGYILWTLMTGDQEDPPRGPHRLDRRLAPEPVRPHSGGNLRS
jgi:hypothetical protein